MPNIDWSAINITGLSVMDVLDFSTGGFVRLHLQLLFMNALEADRMLPADHWNVFRSR